MKRKKNEPEHTRNKASTGSNCLEAYNQPSDINVNHDNCAEADAVKRQFHPAFCAAMELELRRDKEHLIFEKEYNLNTKPNRIDLLIINADTNVRVKSELGAIFRKHNIFEFKSPNDALDVKIYHRTIGYAYLYVTYSRETSSMEDVTVSFLRSRYPRALMKWFRNNGFHIKNFANGIYHITKSGHVDMQVIAANQLGSGYAWINKLTSDLELEDIVQMQKELRMITDENDRINAESVMDLSLSLNAEKEWVKELIGMGMLKDLLDEERQKMREERQKMIKEAEEEKQKLIKETEEERQKLMKETEEERQKLMKKTEEERQKLMKKTEEERQKLMKKTEEERQKIMEEKERISEEKERISEEKERISEELQSKDELLKNEQEKNKKLSREIEELKKQMLEQMGKLAML